MNKNENEIRIVEDVMIKLRGLAHVYNVPLHDFVHSVLSDFLETHGGENDRYGGGSLYEITRGVGRSLARTDSFTINVDLINRAVIVKSSIRYIYRPELRYHISIMRGNELSIGKMSVSLRTHDMRTVKGFSDFVDCWIRLETKYVKYVRRIEYACDMGYFVRKVYMPERGASAGGIGIGAGAGAGVGADAGASAGSGAAMGAGVATGVGASIGAAIGDYVNAFDEMLKHYFLHLDSDDRGGRDRILEIMYLERIREGKIRI